MKKDEVKILKEMHFKTGLTYVEAARSIDINHGVYYKILNGFTENPTIDTLRKIYRFFGKDFALSSYSENPKGVFLFRDIHK